jgi:iron complex transport system substrate-binding protein
MMNLGFKSGLVCAAIVLAAVSARSGNADDTRPVERIVSIGGAVTEILYALGKGDSIVAVDTTSTFPAETETKPKLGYLRALAVEPIIAMKPTMVIADGDAGPPAVLEQLREAGIRLVLAPNEPTVRNVYAKIAVVSDAVGRRDRGAAMNARIKSELRAVKKAIAGLYEKPRVLFLLSVGRGSPLAGGNETSADTIINLSGGVNAAAGFTKYKPIPPEAVVASRPDILLVTNRTLDLMGGPEKFLSRPEIAATPAGRNGRIVSMEGLLLLGFGARTGIAARMLAARLHPGLSLNDTMK